MTGGGGGREGSIVYYKLVAKLMMYREIEWLLLVDSVLIKTFDLKLDFCPHIIFCIIEFKIKIYNIYYDILIIVPKGLLVTWLATYKKIWVLLQGK